MSNTLLTVSKITKEAMRVLHNACVASKAANRQWEKEYSVEGMKIGPTINIRKPDRAALRTGRTVQVQGITDDYVTLTVGDMVGTDFSFNSSELSLSVEKFAERYLTPRMARIASKIDSDVNALALQVYNAVGTPGTTPGTGGGTATGMAQYNSPICFLNAGVMLDNAATPRDGRRKCILNPLASAQTVQGLSGLFNPDSAISRQFTEGHMGKSDVLGFEFGMSQNVNSYTTGTRAVSGEITVQANSTTGDSTIALTGGTGTISAGDVFTITSSGGVKVCSVNPETQASTGILQKFVVTEAITMSGTTTVKIAPKIIVTGTGVANGTVDRLPTATDLVTWDGAASTVTQMNWAFHPDAVALAMIDLPLPGGQDMCARESYDGFSVRVIRYYSGDNDLWICRLDVQYAVGLVRPELAVRIHG